MRIPSRDFTDVILAIDNYEYEDEDENIYRNPLHNGSLNVCPILVFVLKMAQLIFMISVLTDLKVNMSPRTCKTVN